MRVTSDVQGLIMPMRAAAGKRRVTAFDETAGLTRDLRASFDELLICGVAYGARSATRKIVPFEDALVASAAHSSDFHISSHARA